MAQTEPPRIGPVAAGDLRIGLIAAGDLRIGLVAAGDMGHAVGRRLVERGAVVLTSLAGRSAASAKRAQAAGLVAAEDDRALTRVDLFLSIVPPGQAMALPERIAAPP